jgi:hypothetical protein
VADDDVVWHWQRGKSGPKWLQAGTLLSNALEVKPLSVPRHPPLRSSPKVASRTFALVRLPSGPLTRLSEVLLKSIFYDLPGCNHEHFALCCF